MRVKQGGLVSNFPGTFSQRQSGESSVSLRYSSPQSVVSSPVNPVSAYQSRLSRFGDAGCLRLRYEYSLCHQSSKFDPFAADTALRALFFRLWRPGQDVALS